MLKEKILNGFSKITRSGKINKVSHGLADADLFKDLLNSHLHMNSEIQNKYENFSENTLSNYFLPFNVAPNFLVNNTVFHVPMVTEESSVVAAASSAAKFWAQRGGFKASVKDTIKLGQIHFEFFGSVKELEDLLVRYKKDLISGVAFITRKMEKRGGGILDIQLIDKSRDLSNYFQLLVKFRTADSMGANFINSCLETLAKHWSDIVRQNQESKEKEYQHIMSILSNYTPECLVQVEVGCDISGLDSVYQGLSGLEFVKKFKKAVDIAKIDIYRAVTHNKGIYNGIDAVILATGNDFRAVEACGHAYAAKSGTYGSLSNVKIENNRFTMALELPMALGTVGGLTQLHPLAAESLKLLKNPSTETLMMIAASVGLANNFSAVKSLITSGIQKGHMKMHLSNILTSLNASKEEQEKSELEFRDKVISYSTVMEFLTKLRTK